MNHKEIELKKLDLFFILSSIRLHQLGLFRFRIFPFRGVLLQNLTDEFTDLDIILLIQICK